MKNTVVKTLLIGACLLQGIYTSAIAKEAETTTGDKPTKMAEEARLLKKLRTDLGTRFKPVTDSAGMHAGGN